MSWLEIEPAMTETHRHIHVGMNNLPKGVTELFSGGN